MDKMLTKFESKSNRVKGLSFHPVRPWILASLHNGQIQLWDYRMGTCLDKFEEHDGPVRGVDFHRTQSLIVSGGDDYKVKVWDYKLRRCLFTLLGHLDYIRTVQFHSEYPWIVSASDDQTIRIWNWQSRNCISVLTGHNHYVMCAAFHPKEDMIVSASLDQTVRVWDTTGLRKKTVRGAPPPMDEGSMVSKVNNELFGGNDAVVKYVLEGHERGVNWASFHPTLPLIISGADDRQVKLWRMNETKAWEVDTMRGHTNNVSCVLFHPKHELIVSNSEDRTIRVWDISKRLGVQTFRRESDRFWILAVHPEQNVLAAGHDSGMTVFKLERERPAYDTFGSRCFYVKDRYLRMHEFSSSKDVPLVSLRRTTGTTTSGIGGGPRTLVFNTLNKNENNVLVLSDTEGGSYELITFAIDSSSSGDAQDIRRGMGVAAVFIARDRFAVLEKSKQLCIKNFQNEVIKKSTPSVAGVDGLFYGGTSGRVLLKSEDRIVLHDFQARKNVSEIQIARVKYVVWNNDYSLVALISKHQIVLANKQLDQLCTINETVRLKGGCWDASKAIFVYTTSNHVKYVLCNGDRGIIRGLDSPVYVTKLQGNSLYCLDREGKMRTMEVDLVEALFKIALENKEYGEVMKMVKHSRLCGQSIITYLQEKGYPEVALHFVHDNKTRFRLALACGNIQVALNVAYELDEEAWQQLGTEALRQGNYEIVEMAYQKTKSFDQLSFLYLITGNTEKLRKMLKISEMRGDVMGVVHNSMYLGDIEERIKCFESTGQLSLAFMTAVAYNLIDSAKRIEDLLHAASLPIPHVPGTASLLMPPTPIVRGDNWSYLSISQSYLSHQSDNAKEKLGKHRLASNEEEEHFEDATAGGNWGDDDLFNDEDEQLSNQKTSKSAPSKSGWEEDDLDLSDDEVSPIAVSGGIESLSAFVPPSNGNSPQLSWCAESSHCADHFAAGAVESAVQLLNRQIGAINMKPLKSACYPIFAGAQAFLPGICQSPAVRNFLVRESNKTNTGSFPTMVYSVKNLLESLKQAYRLFTAAQFDDCRTLLETILNLAPLVPTSSKSEADDLRELLGICREYLVALQLKSGMDESKDISRSLEFAAYFTHCNLQPSHLILALKAAMALAFKNKNFINAASFARRLLDFPEMSSEKNADLRSKAQKVLQKSEQQGRNEYSINYDERNPFSLDCSSFVPLYKGTTTIRCCYCAATYKADVRGNLCNICKLSAVGLETVGLVTQSSARTRSK